MLKSRGVDYFVSKAGPGFPLMINTGQQLSSGSFYSLPIKNFSGYGKYKFFNWDSFKLGKYPY